jgi:hypothetical protein
VPGLPGEGPRHYLRQFSITNSRSLGIQTTKPNYDRGNAYPAPNYLKRARLTGGTPEAFSCAHIGGEVAEAAAGQPPCFEQPPSLWDGNMYPRLLRGQDELKPPPLNNEGSQPVR